MTQPQRIQRKRTSGWRMPPGAKYVGRGTPWGNPFSIEFGKAWHPAVANRPVTEKEAREFVVDLYRQWVTGTLEGWTDQKPSRPLSELRGMDLACWCKPGDLCHADVLLELANKD